MSKNIFALKINNIVFAIVVAIGLHYLLNPSESIGAPLIAKLMRLIPAAAVLAIVFFIAHPKKKIFGLAYLFAFICIWFIFNNFPNNTLALFTLFLFMGCGFLMSAYLFSESKARIVSKGLDFLLFFWVLSLFVQVLVYFITSEVLDFHRWLHPWSEARVHDVGLFIRFTGVLIEPGTYANWVYGVVLLRGIANEKLFDRLSIVSMLSILITLSAWGVMAVGVYLIAYLCKVIILNKDYGYKKKSIALGFSIATLTLIYVWFSGEIGGVFQYLNSRSELMDESGAAKVQAYEGFINIFLRIFLVGVPVDYDFCNNCLSPQDAGIFVNLAIRGGLVFTLAIFFVIAKCIYRRCGAVACVCIFPLAFAKYFYFEPLFWGLFGFCFLDILRLRSGMLGQGSFRYG